MEYIVLSLLLAVLMPILAKWPLAYTQNQQGGYDNKHPRAQQSKLTGFGLRAKSAHENCFEALTLYTPGALAIILLDIADNTMAILAMVFIVCRVLYVVLYWINLDKLRSLFWLVGFGISIYMLVQALFAVWPE